MAYLWKVVDLQSHQGSSKQSHGALELGFLMYVMYIGFRASEKEHKERRKKKERYMRERERYIQRALRFSLFPRYPSNFLVALGVFLGQSKNSDNR